jgi:hypothetical protein
MNMTINKLARELDSRETTKRKTSWVPEELLPQPAAIPGMTFRWIRTAIMGQFDPTNTSAKLREGFEPCKAEDHPEMMLHNDPNSRFKGNVEIGGLMLCKIPTDVLEERAAWFANQSKAQVDSVDNNFMKSNDPRMPLFNERKSSTSFGRGAK